jgi:hypothetical protein
MDMVIGFEHYRVSEQSISSPHCRMEQIKSAVTFCLSGTELSARYRRAARRGRDRSPMRRAHRGRPRVPAERRALSRWLGGFRTQPRQWRGENSARDRSAQATRQVN